MKLNASVHVLNSAVVLHVRMKKITKISSNSEQPYPVVSVVFYWHYK